MDCYKQRADRHNGELAGDQSPATVYIGTLGGGVFELIYHQSWDIDADGKSGIAVWRPDSGIWYVVPSKSLTSYTSTKWGVSGDKPVPGDYDSDGKSDIAVWRPSIGIWYTLPSNSPGTYIATQWGVSSDIPVPGDYDGDGKDDIAVYRPSTGVWYVMLSGTPGTYTARQWGMSEDKPISSLTGILNSIP